MAMKSKKARILLTLLITAIVFTVVLALPTSGLLAKDKDVSLTTNKEDYSPGETVIIKGKNFEPNTYFIVEVIRPGGSIVVGDGSFEPGSDMVYTNASGNFNYHYQLNGIEGTYIIKVKDLGGTLIMEGTFTDATVRW